MKTQLVSNDHPVAIVEGILPEYTKEGILIEDGHIVLIKKGHVHLSINFTIVHQTPETVTILYPGDTVMVVEWSDDAIVETLVFTEGIGRDTFTQLSDVYFRSIQHIRCVNSPQLVGVTNAIMQTVDITLKTLTAKEFHQVILYQLRSFFVILQHILIEQGVNIDTFRSREDQLFANFIRLLSEHIIDERTVNYYAQQLNVTQKYLNNIVHNHTGKSAKTTIDEYAVMRIRHHLLYYDYTIAEIAYLYNFATSSHFCEYFKRLSNETPLQFKHRMQK